MQTCMYTTCTCYSDVFHRRAADATVTTSHITMHTLPIDCTKLVVDTVSNIPKPFLSSINAPIMRHIFFPFFPSVPPHLISSLPLAWFLVLCTHLATTTLSWTLFTQPIMFMYLLCQVLMWMCIHLSYQTRDCYDQQACLGFQLSITDGRLKNSQYWLLTILCSVIDKVEWSIFKCVTCNPSPELCFPAGWLLTAVHILLAAFICEVITSNLHLSDLMGVYNQYYLIGVYHMWWLEPSFKSHQSYTTDGYISSLRLQGSHASQNVQILP